MENKAISRTGRAVAAFANLFDAAESVSAMLDRQLGSFRLTAGQFRALEAIQNFGPLDHQALTGKLWCSSGNTTVVTRNLEKSGLVARGKNVRDRRKAAIQLTAEGKKLLARFLPMRAKLTRAVMSALSGREQDTLIRLCQKLVNGDPLRFVRELTAEFAGDDEAGNGE